MSSNHNTLDAAAADRKARLAKLASLKRKQPEPESLDTESSIPQDEPSDTTPDVTSKFLSGRNYDAETRGPKLGFETAPTEGAETLEQKAAAIAEKLAEEAKEAEKDEPIDLFKLQPKKPNWDLKRDLEVKTKVLDTRTQAAIARLVRERMGAKTVAGSTTGSNGAGAMDGEDTAIDGGKLVGELHVREQEEAEEERREREEYDAL